ncbi:unnamed protein product, partial [Didymodactylos carnosus]
MKTTLVYSLSTLLFAILILLLWNYAIITVGRDGDKTILQNRQRAKLVHENDPNSPYRALEVLDELKSTPEEAVQTLADIPDLAVQRYGERETMGVRETIDVEDETQPNGKIFKKFILGEYKFTTYTILHERILAIGRGLLTLGAQPVKDKILIFSETRSEWLLTAFAAFRHGLTVVTLYSTLGDDAVRHGISESEVEIIVTSNDLIPKLENILKMTPKVRHVIFFPGHTKTSQANPKNNDNLKYYRLQELEDKGRQTQIGNHELLKKRPTKDDIAVIMYTSGSTGTPKGVLLTHENVLAAMTGQKERVFPMVDLKNDIYIAYLPLAHILELSCELLIYYSGLKCGYSSPQTLTDQSTGIKRGQKGDLQVLRPHLMSVVPAILDRIHKAVNIKINQANFIQRYLFHLSYNIKVKRLEHGLQSSYLDRFIFHRFNQLILGGRMKNILCGGALLSEETQRFIETALSVTLFQGYGLTETCAAGTIADRYDISIGRTGYPLISTELRLQNWDEGQYRNTDRPNPRGEIILGGKMVSVGYYGDAVEKTDHDNFRIINGTRYFATGDIGEVYPDGTVKII